MAKIIFIFISFFSFVNCFSQKDFSINADFNWAHTGKNIELSVKKTIKNNNFSFGTSIHLNIPFNDNQLYVFKNRYVSDDFISKFGITFNYELNLKPKNSDIYPFLFYNIRYFKSKLYLDGLCPYGYYMNSQLYVKYNGEYTNKLPVFENNIGIGFKFKLYKKIDFSARVGAGIGFFYIDNDVPFVERNFWEREVTTLFSTGISYVF